MSLLYSRKDIAVWGILEPSRALLQEGVKHLAY